MPRSNFGYKQTVATDAATCWGTITDVEKLVSWISILEAAQQVEPLARYSAVLMDRVGPFRLRADLDIRVTDVSEPASLTIHAEGEDRQVASRIVVDVALSLLLTEGGTEVAIEGSYEVTGRVATMGAGTIRKKADKLIAEFFGHMTEELGGAAS